MDARRGRRNDSGVRRRVTRPPCRHADAARHRQGPARWQRPVHVGHRKLPAQLEAAVLRSPHANAKLTAIDVEAARAVPGVRCVVTADDDLPDYDGSTLLTAEPGYAGAAVAAVAAESPSGGRRAGRAGAAVGGARLHRRHGRRRRRPALSRGSDRVRARRRRRAQPWRARRTSSRPSTGYPPSCTTAWSPTAPLPSGAARTWRFELDPGDLRGPGGAGPGVRDPGRAGARDLRVHGRRVRVEVRRRPRGHSRGDARQAQPAPRPAGLFTSRGEPDGRVPDRGPRRAAGGRRRGRRAGRHRGVGRNGPGQRRLDVPDPRTDEGCLQVRQRSRLRASGR